MMSTSAGNSPRTQGATPTDTARKCFEALVVQIGAYFINTHNPARELAGELSLDVEFVEANVYDAVEALRSRTFDVVYTGLGALIWLPDIRRWADIVAELLRPGGFLYLSESHPITTIFGDEDLSVEHDSFASEEHYTLFPRWPFLVKSGFDTYRLPEGMPKLPLMYSLRARK